MSSDIDDYTSSDIEEIADYMSSDTDDYASSDVEDDDENQVNPGEGGVINRDEMIRFNEIMRLLEGRDRGIVRRLPTKTYQELADLFKSRDYGKILRMIVYDEESIDMRTIVELTNSFNNFLPSPDLNERKIEYYLTFGNKQQIEEQIAIIDQFCMKTVGFVTMDEFEEFMTRAQDAFDNGFISRITFGNTIRDLCLTLTLIFDESLIELVRDRFWIGSGNLRHKRLVENMERFFLTSVFDPLQVIAKINSGEKFISECMSALGAKILSYTDVKTTHIINDFDESYLDYIVDGFINERLNIDFDRCSVVFREAFYKKYLSMISGEPLEQIMDPNFVIGDDNYADFNLQRGNISFALDRLKPLRNERDIKKHIDSLEDYLTPIIDSDTCLDFVVKPAVVINDFEQYRPTCRLQYIEYLLKNRGVEAQYIIEDEDDDEGEIIDGNDLDFLLKGYYWLANDSQKHMTAIFDRILHLSRDINVATELSNLEVPLFRWIGSLRATKTKSSMRR